jgi:antitoxin component YwqK of YwqJK toxin-antitoxin module
MRYDLDLVYQLCEETGLILEDHYKNGERHGSYKSWWDNGALKEQGWHEAGKRVGVYCWFPQNGELWQEHDCGKPAR